MWHRQPASHERKHHFDYLEELGRGGFGIVKRARNKDTGKEYACKIVLKADVIHMDNQIAIMDMLITLDHPRIVKLYEWFESKTKFYMMFELAEGGELFDHLFERGRGFSESGARIMAHGLLSAVVYNHERRIIHRDIKTENLLCRLKWQPGAEEGTDAEGNPFDSALSDFGLAIQLKEGELLTEPAGSPAYAAPEAMSGERYGLPADIWSVGIVIFVLLACRFPFTGADAPTVRREAQQPIDFPPRPWNVISPEAKDLIRQLLQFDPAKRPTAQQAIHHPWFARLGSASAAPSPITSGTATPVSPQDAPDNAPLVRVPTQVQPHHGKV